MRRFARQQSLSLFFLTIFALAVVGQAIAGHADFNHQQLAHQNAPISLGRFITSSTFGNDVLENWQSEYLQFTLFILGTVWLLQRGSPESKELDQAGTETDADQKVKQHAIKSSPAWARAEGFRLWLLSNSLLLVMASIWIASWAVQSILGHVVYNDEQLDHQEAPVSWLAYVGTGDFWNRTLQNWQSEFLAVGSMAVLSIYLRQRGSPESKPVGAPHDATGQTG
jgi:hypothetical protein